MRRVLAALTLAAGLFGPVAGAFAEDRFAPLGEPRTVAIMRHSLAPGTGDPANFELGDCTTQRNLNDTGREQARAVGRAIRAAGVEIDRVLTSRWCRCRETAELLGVGEVTPFPALDSFFADRSTADDQTLAVREFLTQLPPEENAVLVTHQVNISALTGSGVRSGEVFLLRVGQDGSVEILDRITVEP